MTRKEILSTAEACVCGQREQDYGAPEDSFEIIADMWAAYLQGCGVEIDFLEGHDVAAMLALLKIARIASGHGKLDNWVDLAGYAACGGEIESGGEKAKKPLNVGPLEVTKNGEGIKVTFQPAEDYLEWLRKMGADVVKAENGGEDKRVESDAVETEEEEPDGPGIHHNVFCVGRKCLCNRCKNDGDTCDCSFASGCPITTCPDYEPEEGKEK